MLRVVSATARSPARRCTSGASDATKGLSTRRSVSSVGRFFNDTSNTSVSHNSFCADACKNLFTTSSYVLGTRSNSSSLHSDSSP